MAAQLPLYHHPTMTVLIDDDRSSLVCLQYQLDPAIAKKTFNKARAALDWVTERFLSALQIRPPLQLADDPDAPTAVRNIDHELEHIYRYIGGPERFSLPAVVVIDYSMPDMDGIEFCQEAVDLPAKKILFTSLGDDGVAIDAFNHGLISRFVRKRDADAIDQIERNIEELQYDYFLEQTGEHVGRLDMRRFGFMHDRAVRALLKDVCDRYGYVEFYLLTCPTSYLLFDEHGRSTLLIIQTRASLREQSWAVFNSGSPALVEDLAACRVVPFFHSQDGLWHADMPGDPAAYCKPAQICHGEDDDYYWALFEAPAHFAKGTPYSHAQFMAEQGAGA